MLFTKACSEAQLIQQDEGTVMVEVCGALLKCVYDAGVTMRLLAPDDEAAQRWETATWYPLDELEALQARIIRQCRPEPILDRLGEEMIVAWYDQAGEAHLKSQLAEVLCARVGPASAYNALVRSAAGPEQGLVLSTMDEEQGLAVVRSTTIFDSALERGMLRGALHACKDLFFYEVRPQNFGKHYAIYFVDARNHDSVLWAPPRSEAEWRLSHWRRRFEARESFEYSVNKALQATAAELQSTHRVLLLKDKLATLGTLAAGVSHEMNNPTTFAHAGAQLLGTRLEHFRTFLMNIAGDDASPAVIDALNTHVNDLAQQVSVILEGTTRVSRLLKDFRSMARPDEEEKRPAAVFDSLASTINLVRTQYAGVASIECQLEDNPVLMCWPAQLGQVYMNLIVNACQAIERKRKLSGSDEPGRILIHSCYQDAWLRIEFSDDGCGIPEAMLPAIFDPFVTTKLDGGGTGLGLSISAGIIARHGGTIQAYSDGDVGSQFVIELPLG
jgi:signal transduction histidine kinase